MRALTPLLLVFLCQCTAPTEGTGTTVATDTGSETTDAETTPTTAAPTTETPTTDPTTETPTTAPITETDSTSEPPTTDPTTTEGETGPFDSAVQFYCLGVCRVSEPPVGDNDCDQADADLFCQLVTGQSDSVAVAWEESSIIDGPGFCCAGMGWGEMVPFGDFSVCWEPDNLLPEHGEGGVVIHRETLECE